MDTDKRKIIIHEIEYWRKNRLLPEQYCDFLQNLYREGEESQGRRVLGLSPGQIKDAKPLTWILIFSLVGIIFYVGFYFTSFPFPMQIMLIALTVLLFFTLGVKNRVMKPTVSYSYLWAGAIIAPTAGFYFIMEHGGEPSALAILLSVTALFWIVTGVTSRFASFHFCGWLIIAIIYGWMLLQIISEPEIITLQLYWLPLGTIIAWLGFLLRNRSEANGWVLVAAGALMWIGPEIYGLTLTGIADGLLQVILALKLIASIMLLYTTRRKWTEWV
ncbi:MAG: hypothetical protein H7X86_03365, partial [Gorillibacterium sp.]|nr:hypothetical protein [Gorillibacterium sp.]